MTLNFLKSIAFRSLLLLSTTVRH